MRYEGDNGEPDLALTDDMTLVVSGGTHMGRLTTLLEWVQLDPVDGAERQRNDTVYTSYQNNRNPFVDHPEWIIAIFGSVMHLEISGQPGAVTLAWPTGLRRCHLQSSLDLQHWNDVTLPVTTTGNQDTVAVATMGGNWYFRLELR